MSKSLIYWICQIAGWGLYTLFLLGMIGLFGGIENLNRSTIILQLIIYVTLIIFSHLFRLYMIKKGWLELKLTRLIPKAVFGILCTSIISQAFIHLFIYVLTPLPGLSSFGWYNFFAYSLNVFLVLVPWTSIYFAVKFIQKNRRSEIEKLELTSALQESELMVLKNQINPHFMFNALNNIRSLILIEPEKARKMVTHISDLLRYSIQFNASETVSLKEEVEIVKDYLTLEKIQFNERLTYDFEIESSTETIQIPPMSIQLLVENGIKHGLSVSKNGGHIAIRTGMNKEGLCIEVTNTGQLGGTKKREGIGIKNLMERMKILFGQYAQFTILNASETTVKATLIIPQK